jgi:cob(I)alamin adenosyltransferase
MRGTARGLDIIMSIATKTGDKGSTALMYNRRVSKCDPRVDAYGTVDELNGTIGLARATASSDFPREKLWAIQKDLIVLMGELATSIEDRERYIKDGFTIVTPEMTGLLDRLVTELESKRSPQRHWAIPGGTIQSSALDLSRAICRRAERRVCFLHENNQLANPEIIVYLNRLSDLLWLFARSAEETAESPEQP